MKTSTKVVIGVGAGYLLTGLAVFLRRSAAVNAQCQIAQSNPDTPADMVQVYCTPANPFLIVTWLPDYVTSFFETEVL